MKEYEYVSKGRRGRGQGLDDEEAGRRASVFEAGAKYRHCRGTVMSSTPTKSVRNSYWELPHDEVLDSGVMLRKHIGHIVIVREVCNICLL